MFTAKEYVRAESLEQAWSLNQKKSSAVLGGMMWLKMGNGRKGTIIDLSGLGLDTIQEDDREFLHRGHVHPAPAGDPSGAEPGL